MNNLKAEEYFLDLYKSTENEYHQLIRAVRIDSPNSAYSKKGESDSKFTTISIVAIFRMDKKKYTVGTYIISDFEADFETIKKGGAGYLETKNIASDENLNKKELDAFVLDEKSQLEVINNWIKFTKERGPWSIIQDPWNPSVIVDFIPRKPQPWDKPVEKPVEKIIGTPSNAEMIIAGSPSIAPVELGLTFSKIQLLVDGIPDDLSIPAKTDMPTFYVYVGDLAKKVYDEFNDLGDLDPEYSEDVYRAPDDEVTVLPSGQVIYLFDNAELNRNDGDVADGSGVGVQIGGSLVVQPGGVVSTTSLSLPADLAGVQNSSKITTNLSQTITSPTGNKTTSAQLFKNMNEFVSDCIGPFATFLKNKYPSLYKGWYITSATRNYTPDGGSATSEHFKGKAIDSQILGAGANNPGENIKLLNAIFEWYQDNPVGYGQILFETRTTEGRNSCWIHWSYTRESKPRMMFARFKNDDTLSVPANKTGSYLKPPISAAALGFK